jgi:hypothetical protein
VGRCTLSMISQRGVNTDFKLVSQDHDYSESPLRPDISAQAQGNTIDSNNSKFTTMALSRSTGSSLVIWAPSNVL